MKLRHILACPALFLAMVSPAQQINPITKAVLDGYTQTLKENPRDFETLYQRAAQYYSLSMYDNALADIVKAIDCTPSKEKDALMREFALMADIDIELKEYDKALVAVDKALEINPESYPDLYRKGNILLHLKNGEAAYRTFSSMQRLKSRSQEAYFGMAKARLLTGQKSEAEALMREALNADPTSPVSFCRIGDLYREMGDNRQAAANYLSAFALGSSSDRPLQSMIDIAADDFQSMADAIDYALSRSDNQIPLFFLKGNIANHTGNYPQAYEAFNSLLKIPAGQAPSVYAALAETCLALNKTEEAATNISTALENENNVSDLILQARISRAAARPADALLSATKALEGDPGNVDALVQASLANIDLKDYQKAQQALNEAILADPSSPLPLMLRAYLNDQWLNNPKAAVTDRNRVATAPAEKFPAIALKALAKARNGKRIDADEIITDALKADTASKDDCFWAAVYYAQTGNLEAAKEWRDRALSLGFSNLYLLNSDNLPGLNLQPLSHL